MSRNMIEAYGRLFAHLEDFCAARQNPVENPRSPRWAAADSKDAREVLKSLKVRSHVRFDSQRIVAWAEVHRRYYICLVGFHFEPRIANVLPQDVHSGFSMAVLSEFLPLPARSPAEVRNVVEVGHKGDGGYSGHDPRALEGLFPAIQVLECSGDVDVEAAHQIFLRICVEECRRGASWISDELADGLEALTDLAVPELPYAAIGRSIFDSDPRSVFMAVYRCIEATYAYESMRRVVERLGLTHSWRELAKALELEVGWHPQEASSLNLVLVNALDRDLLGICECLGVEPGQDLRSSTGKAIYRLRNEIVHYRPGLDSARHQNLDWNRLCSRMIDIVFHTFTRAYVAS